jgi:hypothetical protein
VSVPDEWTRYVGSIGETGDQDTAWLSFPFTSVWRHTYFAPAMSSVVMFIQSLIFNDSIPMMKIFSVSECPYF